MMFDYATQREHEATNAADGYHCRSCNGFLPAEEFENEEFICDLCMEEIDNERLSQDNQKESPR